MVEMTAKVWVYGFGRRTTNGRPYDGVNGRLLYGRALVINKDERKDVGLLAEALREIGRE